MSEEKILRVFVNSDRVVAAGPFTHSSKLGEQNGWEEIAISVEEWESVSALTKVIEEDGSIREATDIEALSIASIPESVDTWKLAAIIESEGLMDLVTGSIDALPIEMRIFVKAGWEKAPVIRRDNPFVLGLIDADNGITNELVNQWFVKSNLIAD